MNPFFTALLSILFALLFAGLANLGLLLFRRWTNSDNHRSNRDVGGILFGAVSLIYSLILAFVIVAVWQDYEDLTNTIEKESVKLSSLMMHASAMPDSLARPVRKQVIEYTESIMKNEWGKRPAAGNNPGGLRRMYSLLANQQGATASAQKVLDNVTDDISDVSDLRRDRMSHQRSHVPLAVWVMLIAGSVIVIIFSYYLSSDNPGLHRVWITMFSFLIGLCIALVYMLDKPFTYAGIDKSPYAQVLRMSQWMKN